MAAEVTTPNITDMVENMTNCTFSDIEEDYASQDFRTAYTMIHGYLASFVCLAGILCNLANIVVLSRPKMSSSPINFHLMIIAIADLLLMLVYLPLAISHYILADPDLAPLVSRTRPPAVYLYFQSSIAVLFHSTAIWHTIAVATFRLICLGITNGKIYCTKRNAVICSLVLICVNILMSIPNWLTNTVVNWNETHCDHPDEVINVYSVAAIVTQFNGWLYACFGKIIPCVLLTLLTIPLVYIMHKAEQRRCQLLVKGKNEESKRHQEHNRTTAMLLVVVIIFLIVEFPHGILIICLKYYSTLYPIYEAIGELIDLITLIAFSITFILYTIMSRQFRTTFFSLFCKQATQIPQSSTFRRFSTLVTQGKLSVAGSSGNGYSRGKNSWASSETDSPYRKHENHHLSPIQPLLGDSSSNTLETSIG